MQEKLLRVSLLRHVRRRQSLEGKEAYYSAPKIEMEQNLISTRLLQFQHRQLLTSGDPSNQMLVKTHIRDDGGGFPLLVFVPATQVPPPLKF